MWCWWNHFFFITFLRGSGILLRELKVSGYLVFRWKMSYLWNLVCSNHAVVVQHKIVWTSFRVKDVLFMKICVQQSCCAVQHKIVWGAYLLCSLTIAIITNSCYVNSLEYLYWFLWLWEHICLHYFTLVMILQSIFRIGFKLGIELPKLLPTQPILGVGLTWYHWY